MSSNNIYKLFNRNYIC